VFRHLISLLPGITKYDRAATRKLINANLASDVPRAKLAVAVRPRLKLGLVASTAGLVEAMRSQVRAKNISIVRVPPGGSGLHDLLGYAMPGLEGQARPPAIRTSRAALVRACGQSPADSPWVEEIEAEVAASSNVVLGDDRDVTDLEGGRNGYR
jgi:hypothetical protein